MASLKDIKRRIDSVKSTQKITNAMKLVSAAKFARANHMVVGSKPYAEAFSGLVSRLLSIATERNISTDSPFLEIKREQKILLVVFATDRGLCGGLNANLFKATDRFIEKKRAEGVEIELFVCGRRAISYSRRKPNFAVVEKREKVFEDPVFQSNDLAKVFGSDFIDAKHDAIYAIYPRYQSALEQIPTVQKLLPIDLNEIPKNESELAADLIVEPSPEQFIDQLLERQLLGAVYHILLSGAASEHGARMTAMDSATNNAKDVIGKLTLQYNRARQAAITTELTEIISGAEAIN